MSKPEIDSAKLTPCPFCSLPDIIVERKNRVGYFATCTSCLSQGPTQSSRAEAAEAWNRRLQYGEAIGAGWERHSIEDRLRLQRDAGIPHIPTDMTYEARLAIAGEGPRGFEWSDKKHRLVYDLCREIERLAALSAAAKVPAGREGVVVARLHRKHGLGPVIERLDEAWNVGTGLFELHAVKVANADGSPVFTLSTQEGK